MRLIIFFSLILLVFSCSHSPKPAKVQHNKEKNSQSTANHQVGERKTDKQQNKSTRFSFFTHLQPEGWAYVISENGKQIINQETIPGVQGNQGFKTSQEAQKVAELVIQKLEKGAFPPTVSEEELGTLGISWMK